MASTSRNTYGFKAGFLGALILIAITYGLELVGFSKPGFVQTFQSVIGSHSPITDNLAAGCLFALTGGLWGVAYTWLVPVSSVQSGFWFGLAPTLWLWTLVAPLTGRPLFNGFDPMGLLMPPILNMLIWGTFVGWLCQGYTGERSTHVVPVKPKSTVVG